MFLVSNIPYELCAPEFIECKPAGCYDNKADVTKSCMKENATTNIQLPMGVEIAEVCYCESELCNAGNKGSIDVMLWIIYCGIVFVNVL